MKRKILFALWGGLFCLCAGLGFLPEPEGGLRAVLTGLSLLCFLPPFLLLRMGEKDDLHLLRNLAALSLGLTLAALVGNFLCAFSSERLGLTMHYILLIVSSPMVCSGNWALSLFLWACLLTAARKKLRR